MSQDLLIGTTNFGGGKTTFNKTLRIKESDTHFRILPPMYSLVQSGRYAQFQATHWMQRGSAKWVAFASNELKEKQGSKYVVVKPDPLQVKFDENMKIYQQARDEFTKGSAQFTEDDLKAFYNLNVLPYKISKRYYLNVITLDNSVTTLELPMTAFHAVDELLKRLKNEYAIDATDLTNGVFVTVHKSGIGRDTKYSAELMREKFNDGTNGLVERPKKHTVTPEIMEQMKIHCRDLTSLFKQLSDQDMNEIANSSVENRPAVLDRIFAKPETAQEVDGGDEEDLGGAVINAPNVSGVKSFSTFSVGASGSTLNTPNFSTAAPTVNPIAKPVDVIQQASQAIIQPAKPVKPPTAPIVGSGKLSNDQFKQLFMKKS